MADEIVAKSTDAKFTLHSEGQYAARCVDTIALGEKVEQFGEFPAKLVTKIALVFRTGEANPETGDFIDIATEYTLSMGERANLRKFLEAWRGKQYSEEQAQAGVPIHKLVGQVALLSIGHKQSRKARTYAYISTAMPLPKGMSAPPETEYTRAEYWADRKKEYAAGAAAFRAAARPIDDDGGDFPTGPDDDDDSLPF